MREVVVLSLEKFSFGRVIGDDDVGHAEAVCDEVGVVQSGEEDIQGVSVKLVHEVVEIDRLIYEEDVDDLVDVFLPQSISHIVEGNVKSHIRKERFHRGLDDLEDGRREDR